MLSSTVVKKLLLIARENFLWQKMGKFELSLVLLLILQLLFSGCSLQMREIVVENFDDQVIPGDWFINSKLYSFEPNGLKVTGPTEIVIPLGGYVEGNLNVEIEVEFPGNAKIDCSLDAGINMSGFQQLSLMLAGSKYPRHIATRHQCEIGVSTKQVCDKIGPRLIKFEFHGKHMRAFVEDQKIISAIDESPQRSAGVVYLGFQNDCFIHKIRISTDGQFKKPLQIVSKTNDSFGLEVCVDFVDDLQSAPYNKDMFNALFAEFKSWGVSRVHWIYYGKMADGWWDHHHKNVMETYRNVGEIFDAAVKAAHKHDIEIFGLIKPFDMGLQSSYAEETPDAINNGKIQRIGGPVGLIANFAAEHRELIMSRRPGTYGPPENDVFTRIDLVKEDNRPCDLSIKDIKLYVSNDNLTYRIYEGPVSKKESVEDYPVYIHTPSGARKIGETRKARVFRLDNLNISDKYVLVYTENRDGSFSNKLINLIHVFGKKGEQDRLTYGVRPRRGAFQKTGVEFDKWHGAVTGVGAGGRDAIDPSFTLDITHGFIAIARGKDSGTLAALSPSFPETRQWWLSWVRDILEAGADGVELRVRNHHSHLAWGEYGFETPVANSFKQRYGVDILNTDDFDRAAHCRLRGEAYTQFYREAKQLVKDYNKKLGLHISISMDTEPEQGGAMGIHWDWRSWLKEGLADSVTMKDIWPSSNFGQEILSYAKSKNVPVMFCPYVNHYWSKSYGIDSSNPDATSYAEKMTENLIKLARENGLDGYQFYECAAVIKPTNDGKIIMQYPELRELFKKTFVEK